MFLAWMPFTFSIILITFFHLLAKIGMGVPPILLEPVVDFYIIGLGAMGTLCFFFRQFIMFIAYFIMITLGLILVYIQYVL